MKVILITQTTEEKFEVEDLVYVRDSELGMIIAIDKNDQEYPYLVRVGKENEWFAEYEMELVDFDSLLDEGEKELKHLEDEDDEFAFFL